MLMLLPERTDGMRQMVRDLQQGSLLHVINNELEESEYVVSIPKFSIEFNSDLVPALNKVKQTPAALFRLRRGEDLSTLEAGKLR